MDRTRMRSEELFKCRLLRGVTFDPNGTVICVEFRVVGWFGHVGLESRAVACWISDFTQNGGHIGMFFVWTSVDLARSTVGISHINVLRRLAWIQSFSVVVLLQWSRFGSVSTCLVDVVSRFCSCFHIECASYWILTHRGGSWLTRSWPLRRRRSCCLMFTTRVGCGHSAERWSRGFFILTWRLCW